MKLLCLETTCDETAAAVISDDLVVSGSVVASQTPLHREYRGIVPEIAARAHLERILPVIDAALAQAGCSIDDVDAVAVATTPGLAGSLLVGLVAAKTLAWVKGIPLIAIDHLQAHVYACRMVAGRDVFPCIGMVVSGGHTHLFRCRDAIDFEPIGGTIDDAAGEAFDKVASMLGLPYPGGPPISALAAQGDPQAYRFPRPLLGDERLDFSFSGLKTAVRYALAGPGRTEIDPAVLTPTTRANIAASFQAAVVDCLVGKALAACRRFRSDRLCVGGGVAANLAFRQRLNEECRRAGIDLVAAPPDLCTDNAVMGAIAFERWKAGKVESLDLDVLPGLLRL